MKYPIFFSVCLVVLSTQLNAQQKPVDNYVQPTDSLVIRKLDQWQDQKFGLLMHWGLYAQLGVVESWGLCSGHIKYLGTKQIICAI